MPLILEVVGQKAAQMGEGTRKTFEGGGTIGRLNDNDWVLPDAYISAQHAKIASANGAFTIEDTSTNGVFINSPDNRLPKGQPYTLRDGDTLYIDDYEIRVALKSPHAAAPVRVPPAVPRVDVSSAIPGSIGAPDATDPLDLLGLKTRPEFAAGPSVDSLAGQSPLSQHYQPPRSSSPPATPPTPRAVPRSVIPNDYNPFSPEEPALPEPEERPRVPTPGQTRPARVVVSATAEITNAPKSASDLDFAALLSAAGIESMKVTPELAQQFGKILRVVVSGLMDVLRARDTIKTEFRLRVTTFKPHDNNPIKYSANVEDALHNLLVKRNAAYLGPVEAFEDAFQDVRHHQMSMLAGMRCAYAAMLAEFDPARLQKEFDRQSKTSSSLLGARKPKYWELYRNRFDDWAKDADASFRRLFGDEFAKAYEAQLVRLRALSHPETKQP